MDNSSSFEISSETLEKSYREHNDSEELDEFCLDEIACCSIKDIKNPVKKKVNELSQLQAKCKNLSTKTLQRIIPLINSTPGAVIEIPNDKRYLKKMTERPFEPLYYAKCSFCGETNLCKEMCNNCQKVVPKKRNNFFVYFPIEPQIKRFLINNLEDICEYINRQRSELLTDIDDGLVLKTMMANEQQKLLSFVLNIDGGNIVEKTKKSLWPIMLYQNYLPPKKRFLPENIIVAGLFYDIGKPDPFEFLFPLLRDMQRLFHEGINLIYNGTHFDFKPVLLHSCCDLPARAVIQNFKLYSGTDACPYCLHSGYRNKENGRTRIRYLKEKEESTLKSNELIVECAHRTDNTHGVKGLSALMVLPHFDIIKGVPTDYMHNVLLGCMKRLLSIWLGDLKLIDSTFKPISKRNKAILNQRLTALKPYKIINYKPRSLEYMSLFRAVEFKNLLFYFLRYALNNLIDKRYIEHFEMLSASIYMLCMEKVSAREINEAQEMLNKFCDLFETYYGKSSITMNIHLLRHYRFVVHNCGPLWCYSLFGFETNMGVISQYYSGGGEVIEQITSKYIISMSNVQNNDLLSDKTRKYFIKTNVPNKYDHILYEQGFHVNDGKATEITVGKCSFKSIFSKDTKSIDYFLSMNDGSFGVAIYYVIKEGHIFVLLNLYKEIKKNFHLKEVDNAETYRVYPFDAIQKKMLYLQFGTIEIITEPPNYYEK